VAEEDVADGEDRRDEGDLKPGNPWSVEDCGEVESCARAMRGEDAVVTAGVISSHKRRRARRPAPRIALGDRSATSAMSVPTAAAVWTTPAAMGARSQNGVALG
jgi:hypothetical protein